MGGSGRVPRPLVHLDQEILLGHRVAPDWAEYRPVIGLDIYRRHSLVTQSTSGADLQHHPGLAREPDLGRGDGWIQLCLLHSPRGPCGIVAAHCSHPLNPQRLRRGSSQRIHPIRGRTRDYRPDTGRIVNVGGSVQKPKFYGVGGSRHRCAHCSHRISHAEYRHCIADHDRSGTCISF